MLSNAVEGHKRFRGMSVNSYQTTWNHIAGDSTLHSHWFEKLKSNVFISFLLVAHHMRKSFHDKKFISSGSGIFIWNIFLLWYIFNRDRLCGLVVRVPGYRSRGPGFDSRRCQIFWEMVGLEQGPLSLVRIIEEQLEWKSSGSSLENRINGRRDPLRWLCDTLYPQKLALTSPTSGGRSVGIVRLRTKSHGV
jgi:hypothetical protein